MMMVKMITMLVMHSFRIEKTVDVGQREKGDGLKTSEQYSFERQLSAAKMKGRSNQQDLT